MFNAREKPHINVKAIVSYQDRNKTLKAMGYATYNDYLKSPLWNKIKSIVFVQKGRDCYLCPKKANIIHHKGYGRDTLEGKNIDPLIPLCDGCHEYIEFKRNGVKRSLQDVERKFNSLVKSKNARTLKRVDKCNVPGRCRGCGALPRKNYEYCRRCMKERGIKVVIKCPICGDAPKLEDNVGCGSCVSKRVATGWISKRNQRKMKRQEERDKIAKQVADISKWVTDRRKERERLAEEEEPVEIPLPVYVL